MKQRYALFLLFCIVPLTHIQSETAPVQQEENIDYGPQILQQAGGVMINWINLLQDPNNADHALPLAVNMLQGIATIAILASKRNMDINEYLTTTREGKKQLRKWIDLSKKRGISFN